MFESFVLIIFKKIFLISNRYQIIIQIWISIIIFYFNISV